MKAAGSLQLSQIWGVNCRNLEASRSRSSKQVKGQGLGLGSLGRDRLPLLLSSGLSSPPSLLRRQDSLGIRLSDSLYRPILSLSYRINAFSCHDSVVPRGQPLKFPGVKAAALTVDEENDNDRKKCIDPLLLWCSAILICSVLDPVVLPTEASQIVKQRLLDFIRSLSTLLAFSCCFSSVIQQVQKYFMGSNEPADATNMGFQSARNARKALYFAVGLLIAMKLVGFPAQKWLTVGVLWTVLLFLHGREMFTDFHSSGMIHATQPFALNDCIQTKIDGYEVSGTVEHVGRGAPTTIRGEVGEEIFIPNHKFTANVVRNLGRRSHWPIKTQLAISHLDAHKIKNILADMRKVLEKDPRVENREVFLDNVNPGNQALIISVSFNMKTSHFEEYLPVKEAIMLDLLGVISRHEARLAK